MFIPLSSELQIWLNLFFPFIVAATTAACIWSSSRRPGGSNRVYPHVAASMAPGLVAGCSTQSLFGLAEEADQYSTKWLRSLRESFSTHLQNSSSESGWGPLKVVNLRRSVRVNLAPSVMTNWGGGKVVRSNYPKPKKPPGWQSPTGWLSLQKRSF